MTLLHSFLNVGFLARQRARVGTPRMIATLILTLNRCRPQRSLRCGSPPDPSIGSTERELVTDLHHKTRRDLPSTTMVDSVHAGLGGSTTWSPLASANPPGARVRRCTTCSRGDSNNIA